MRKVSGRTLALHGAAIAVTALILAGISSALAGITVPPIPPQKPLHQTVERIHDVEHSETIPVPAKKPNLFRPQVTHLLSFGQVPIPAKKPMGRIGEKLSPKDAALYRQIFAYQSKGQIDKADELIAELGDMRLRGHVLFQRYMHPTAYRTTFDELNAWMAAYADHPGADRIYRLALARQPKDHKSAIRKPEGSANSRGYLNILFDNGSVYKTDKSRTASQRQYVRDLTKQIKSLVSKGSPTAAYKKLQRAEADNIIDDIEYDGLRAYIARGYMIAGKLKEARKLSYASARRSGEYVPVAGWVGGLVSWRLGDYKRAATLFELTAKSPFSSSWTRSAGAYWASRAYMRAGMHHKVNGWLKVAAGEPRTFYGLIATRALGWDYDFNWDMPAYTKEYQELLKQYPAVWRAEALVMAEQNHLAEAELKRINVKDNPKLKDAVLAYVHYAGMPSFAMRLAESTAHPGGGLYDSAFYPLSPWRPKTDYKIDRALVNAFIRQESRFNPYAENRSGATGLMQIMPGTASFIAKSSPSLRGTDRHSLKDPQLNLEIGQRYLSTLLDQNHINNELFSLAIAYNAGPGNLRKWKKKYADTVHDPLLFVETIPSSETRAFVERVLSNYWIYRKRLKQPTPSLDSVAAGSWPQYVQLDRVQHAKVVPHKPAQKPYELAKSYAERLNR